MGAHRIFSGGGQIRGFGDDLSKSRSRTPVEIWGPSPQKPTKNCENDA